MRQILALDLDGVDMSLIDKARLKLSSDHVARSPELLPSQSRTNNNLFRINAHLFWLHTQLEGINE